MNEIFQFRTRINPSWLAAARVASPLMRIQAPFPLMNLVAREKGVTAALDGGILILTIAPGEPPPGWPLQQLDLLALVQGHGDAVSMLNAIRKAPSIAAKPALERLSPGKKPRPSRAQDTSTAASVPVGYALSSAHPEEVWAAIRERKGEPFTVVELQETLGAGVVPYVMLWARDGYLVKVGRAPSSGAPWRYRLTRDHPTHPPVE
ncbi:MAG: hypothetical protein HYZ72_05855 [Deltaproteobacteria bacterium]|nr:hypothetical protein [Deltaproteobacteria bacterium]